MNKTLYKCRRISVDCCLNSYANLSDENSNFLGFDFNIEVSKFDEMIDFVKKTLKEFEVPILNISFSDTFMATKDQIWNKKRILNEIKEQAVYMVEDMNDSFEY